MSSFWIAHGIAFFLMLTGGFFWAAAGAFTEERKQGLRDVNWQIKFAAIVGTLMFIAALTIV